MKESHNSYMQNMEDISNDDGMNSDLDDHEDEEDDEEFVHSSTSSFNRSKNNLDDDLLFNNNKERYSFGSKKATYQNISKCI
jgi:hypothetical protein